MCGPCHVARDIVSLVVKEYVMSSGRQRGRMSENRKAQVFPFVDVALRLFITFPVANTSRGRSFSKLALVLGVYRFTPHTGMYFRYDMNFLYAAIPVYLIAQRLERCAARHCFRRDPFHCCASKHAWYDYDCVFLYRFMTARCDISGQLVKECVTAFKHTIKPMGSSGRTCQRAAA